MGFWHGYWQSLKPLEVEEPIDVWVHRPLAYVLARLVYPTPITPNQITLGSILLGMAAGACIFWSPPLLGVAGLLVFVSTIFDCADGQLARMRKTSSVLGRMLDGCADLIVSLVIVVGGIYLVLAEYGDWSWQGLLVLLACVTTAVTGSFHTGMYDHYKNVYLRNTHPSYREGEDYESALSRYRTTQGSEALWMRIAWLVYLFYVKSQTDYIRRFDPYTWLSSADFTEYDVSRAQAYRAHAASLMRLWRTFFGFGSFVFGMSVTIAFGWVEYYLLFRLLLLNALFYGYMRPAQRAASRAARAAMTMA